MPEADGMDPAVEQESHGRPTCGVEFKGRPPCKNRAGKGTDHVGWGPCSNHGGSLPMVRRHALAQAAEADAQAFLGQIGMEPVEDPIAEIGRLAAGFLATAQAAAQRVNALGEGIRDTDAKGTEQLRAEVGVMERAGDRALRALDIQAKHLAARDADPDGAVEQVVSGLTEVLTRAAERRAREA